MRKYDTLLRFNGRVGEHFQQLHKAFHKTVYTSGAILWTPASLRLSKEERSKLRQASERRKK
jgi:hypothetical protein